MMKEIIFTLISLLFVFELMFAESNITMKDTVYTKTNFILIKDLFEEGINVPYRIEIQTNTFIASQNIASIFNEHNNYNYILLGKGTKVVRIDESDKINFFNYVSKKYPYFSSSKIPIEEKKFLEDKFIIKIDERLQSNSICFYLFYVEFALKTGELKQHSIEVNLADLYPEETNLSEKENSLNYMSFEKLDRNNGIVNLRRGNILIKMKVKIRRKLEPDGFIVENYSSGKTFKVSLKEENKYK